MEEQVVYGSETIRIVDYINYTTLHLNGTFGKPQRIVAAFYKVGDREVDGKKETEFVCQFSFCSPKEKNSHKARGRYVATQRLFSSGGRGGVVFSLPENFTGKMLRNELKHLAVWVATKKNIYWMKGYDESNLV